MAITWGSTTLNVMEYSRPSAPIMLTEKNIIPAPGSTTPQTILMGCGRGRKRISIKGYTTVANYQSMETDKYAFTQRAVSMTDIEASLTFTTGLIESLDMTMYKAVADHVEYNLVLVEVT